MRPRFLGLVLLAAISAVGVTGTTADRRICGGHRIAPPDQRPSRPERLLVSSSSAALRRAERRRSIILDPNAPRDHLPPSGNDDALLPGFPKYKPEFLDRVKDLNDKQVQYDPAYTSDLPGCRGLVPRSGLFKPSGSWPSSTTTLNGNFWRVIPTDGRPHRTSRPPNVRASPIPFLSTRRPMVILSAGGRETHS